jgi:hypothetical protein
MIADCFLVHPEFDEQDRTPLHYQTVGEYQTQDEALNQAVNNIPQHHQRKQFGDTELICHIKQQEKES